MQILTILGRRLGQVILTVVLVALLIFGLMRLLPGDPALALLGDRATDASIARLHHELGLDRSIAVQFWEFLRHAVMLDLGESISPRVPVAQLVRDGTPITLMLTGMAAVLALVIAVPLAFISALRPGSWMDVVIRAVSQVSLSMPVFYIGLVLLIVLAAGLSWAHPFGTDIFGRDILSRTIWASSVDLQIAIFSTLFPAVFGTLVGSVLGYVGGWLDAVFRRIVDVLLTIPFLVLVIVIVAVLGPGLRNMYIAISAVNWIIYARLMRSKVMAQAQRD